MTAAAGSTSTSRSRITRGVFFTLGALCLAVVPISIVTPLVPTGDMVVMALFFFARSSPRFESWLRARPFVQRVLHRYEGGLTRTTKVQATVGIVISLALSAGFLTNNVTIRSMLGFVGIYALWFVWSRPRKALVATPAPA